MPSVAGEPATTSLSGSLCGWPGCGVLFRKQKKEEKNEASLSFIQCEKKLNTVILCM